MGKEKMRQSQTSSENKNLIKKSMERARETAKFTPEENRKQSALLTMMCAGLIWNSYSALTCDSTKNWRATQIVNSTDMWLSLAINNLGIYFPKHIPFFFVMRNQNVLAYAYALITLVLIALAVIGVPQSRKALRYYLTVTTVYLNLRFDVDSGEIVKVSQCCLENTVMILAVIAGMHFLEAKELGNQEKSARRAKNITLAQIAYGKKSGAKEEGLFVTPQETTRKHLENI